HGKVDIRALPEAQPRRQRAFVPPSGATEAAVAAVIAEVLQLREVGADDSFFDLGGHSLLATQVASRLTQALGKPVPVRAILESGTVRRLAAQLDLAEPAQVRTIGKAARRVFPTRSTAGSSDDG
ncbi:MAG TPA: phosphopantetheine-binding protein, partial [Polyangia bacterium]|nr:phosphopantetheine-binding protein [Polyangia bacterium]